MSAISTTAPAPELALAQERIRRLTGLVFSESRHDLLSAGLMRGMKRANASDLTTYLDQLETAPALLDDLVAEITVGETYFFRDPEQCRLIRDRILPALSEDRPHASLRVWSAGCATGEEAYTLAILLSESGSPDPARIVGTDLSRSALARARRGRYGRWSLRGVPADAVARNFQHFGSEFALLPELRRAVEFRYLNLAADEYPSLASGIGRMDLILCRNVLIYFDEETAARVTRRLLETLAPGGWLVLGASDPPAPDFMPCEVVITDAGLVYRHAARPARTTVNTWGACRANPFTKTPPPLEAPAPPSWTEGAPPFAESGATSEHIASVPASVVPTLADAEHAYAARDYAAAALAARQLTRARETDPRSWVVLVRSLANGGDLEAAGRACTAALDRHRTCAELAYLHGVLLSEAGRPADAAAALRACLYLDRTLVVAHLALALAGALTRLDDLIGAHRALRNAERLLAPLPLDAQVPAADGERAGRLTAVARAQRTLLSVEGA